MPAAMRIVHGWGRLDRDVEPAPARFQTPTKTESIEVVTNACRQLLASVVRATRRCLGRGHTGASSPGNISSGNACWPSTSGNDLAHSISSSCSGR